MTAEKMMAEAGARPAFKGYSTPSAGTKYPFVLCTSVNDEIVMACVAKAGFEERRYRFDRHGRSVERILWRFGHHGRVGEIRGSPPADGSDPGIARNGD